MATEAQYLSSSLPVKHLLLFPPPSNISTTRVINRNTPNVVPNATPDMMLIMLERIASVLPRNRATGGILGIYVYVWYA